MTLLLLPSNQEFEQLRFLMSAGKASNLIDVSLQQCEWLLSSFFLGFSSGFIFVLCFSFFSLLKGSESPHSVFWVSFSPPFSTTQPMALPGCKVSRQGELASSAGHLPGDSSSSGFQPTEAGLLESSGRSIPVPVLLCSGVWPQTLWIQSLERSPAPPTVVSVPEERGSAQRWSPVCVWALSLHSQKAAMRHGAVPVSLRQPCSPLPPPLLHISPLRPHTSLADRSYLKALAGCATNGRALSRLPPSPWSPCADVGARHGLL